MPTLREVLDIGLILGAKPRNYPRGPGARPLNPHIAPSGKLYAQGKAKCGQLFAPPSITGFSGCGENFGVRQRTHWKTQRAGKIAAKRISRMRAHRALAELREELRHAA